jgi:hypothetical protein
MELTSPLLTRLICAGLVMALLAPPSAMAGTPNQDPTSVQQPEAPQSGSLAPDAGATSLTSQPQPAQPSRDQLPDSPDPLQSTTPGQSNTGQSNAAPSNPDQAQPSPVAPANPQQTPQGKTQQPAGAAAAEVESTTGDAAYKPAGAAIAPAKQKRRRMLLIKISALLGAGVAIGSVAALSSASPSRPPGSH